MKLVNCEQQLCDVRTVKNYLNATTYYSNYDIEIIDSDSVMIICSE